MRILDTIDSPADVKALPVRELPALAKEVREELIRTIAGLGGHLASSLGAVELCLALHYVFDAPEDQLVWDMGYQAFTHKLITGRRERFRTLKQFGGLSGFNNPNESPHDLFLTGHGGTVLSTGLGLAMARDQAGKSHDVVAILGDASLGEGMALEALNHIGHLKKTNLLVILNDNRMSIAKPIGGLSRYLNRIITNPAYNRARAKLGDVLEKLPSGERFVRLAHKIEESIKGFLVPGQLFEELGLRYVGPIDGHNISELITTLRNVRRMKGPILLHVSTVKGKGYAPAEQDPERFHKTEAFEIATGASRTAPPGSRGLPPAAAFPSPPRAERGAPGSVKGRAAAAVTFTEAFSDELVRLGESNKRIIALTAAMPEGTGVHVFARRFPERCIDVGMAEQHAVGLAAGLARGGARPVVAIYSTFMQRAFDQIMHEVSLQGLPVVLALDRAGLVGEDGPTHHGVFDIAYLRTLPGLSVLSPKDPDEMRAMLRWAVEQPGPVALRYSRGGIVSGTALGRTARIVPGRGELLRSGSEMALLAVGSMVYPALTAAEQLAREGIDAAVFNARFIKPVDEDLLRVAAQTGRIVTLEEAQIAGGFGSAVSEALGSMGLSAVPHLRIGLPDDFVQHGKRGELLRLCQLDPDSLTARIAAWHHATPRTVGDVPMLTQPAE